MFDGVFDPLEGASLETAQWIVALQVTEVEGETSTKITCDGFKAHFHGIEESKVSSPSGRHFGHFKQ